MEDAVAACCGRMETILSVYFQVTVNLLEAIKGSDDEAIAAAVDARSRCLEEYAAAMKEWLALPEAVRGVVMPESLKWHHLRIDEADTDVLRQIRAIQDEVGAEIARIGSARKVQRAYQSSAGDAARIVNGEG